MITAPPTPWPALLATCSLAALVPPVHARTSTPLLLAPAPPTAPLPPSTLYPLAAAAAAPMPPLDPMAANLTGMAAAALAFDGGNSSIGSGAESPCGRQHCLNCVRS